MKKLSPHNISSERAFLGALLADRDAREFIDHITPRMFYLGRHRAIYACIVDLYRKDKTIDTISLAYELEKRKQLTDISIKSYLLELADNIMAFVNVEKHVNIIQEEYYKRELQRIGKMVNQLAFEQNSKEIFSYLEKSVTDLQLQRPSSYYHLSTVLDSILLEIEKIQRNQKPNLPKFGLPELDDILIGWENSFYLLLADSRMGKSAFALYLALIRSIEAPVYFAGVEMSREQLAYRALSVRSQINGMKFKNGNLSTKSLKEIKNKTIPKMKNLKMYFNDNPNLTIYDIDSDCKRLQNDVGNIGLIVIDYIQILKRHDNFDNTREFLEDIARKCKKLAKDYNTPVLIISSVTKKCEYEKRPPTLHDAKGSADLGFGSDITIGFYRPFVYQKSNDKTETRIGILKNRNGKTGKFSLTFELEYQSFHERIEYNDTPYQYSESS
jgi:replicative DNA helicase